MKGSSFANEVGKGSDSWTSRCNWLCSRDGGKLPDCGCAAADTSLSEGAALPVYCSSAAPSGASIKACAN